MTTFKNPLYEGTWESIIEDTKFEKFCNKLQFPINSENVYYTLDHHGIHWFGWRSVLEIRTKSDKPNLIHPEFLVRLRAYAYNNQSKFPNYKALEPKYKKGDVLIYVKPTTEVYLKVDNDFGVLELNTTYKINNIQNKPTYLASPSGITYDLVEAETGNNVSMTYDEQCFISETELRQFIGGTVTGKCSERIFTIKGINLKSGKFLLYVTRDGKEFTAPFTKLLPVLLGTGDDRHYGNYQPPTETVEETKEKTFMLTDNGIKYCPHTLKTDATWVKGLSNRYHYTRKDSICLVKHNNESRVSIVAQLTGSNEYIDITEFYSIDRDSFTEIQPTNPSDIKEGDTVLIMNTTGDDVVDEMCDTVGRIGTVNAKTTRDIRLSVDGERYNWRKQHLFVIKSASTEAKEEPVKKESDPELVAMLPEHMQGYTNITKHRGNCTTNAKYYRGKTDGSNHYAYTGKDSICVSELRGSRSLRAIAQGDHAQLIDHADGKHIAANSYDVPLNAFDAIEPLTQEEISELKVGDAIIIMNLSGMANNHEMLKYVGVLTEVTSNTGVLHIKADSGQWNWRRQHICRLRRNPINKEESAMSEIQPVSNLLTFDADNPNEIEELSPCDDEGYTPNTVFILGARKTSKLTKGSLVVLSYDDGSDQPGIKSLIDFDMYFNDLDSPDYHYVYIDDGMSAIGEYDRKTGTITLTAHHEVQGEFYRSGEVLYVDTDLKVSRANPQTESQPPVAACEKNWRSCPETFDNELTIKTFEIELPTEEKDENMSRNTQNLNISVSTAPMAKTEVTTVFGYNVAELSEGDCRGLLQRVASEKKALLDLDLQKGKSVEKDSYLDRELKALDSARVVLIDTLDAMAAE